MATVAGLDVNLGVRSKEFTRQLNKANRDLKSFGASASKTFKSIAVATAGATAAFAALSRQSLLAADEVAKSARNAGLSAEAFQKLSQTFELSGSTQRALTRGFQAMHRQVRDLSRGLSTQSDAFSVLGIRYRDLANLAPEEQFLLIQSRLSSLTDVTQRSAIAQQIFGRAGKEFGSILEINNEEIREQGERIERLGGIMSNDLLFAAEEVNDEMSTLARVIKAQFTNAILEALPVGENFDDIMKGIGEAVGGTTRAILNIGKALYNMREAIGIALATWLAFKAAAFTQAVVTTIGAVSSAIFVTAKAIRAVGIASFLTTAAIAAIPTLVGLAVAALTLGLIATWDYLAAKVGQIEPMVREFFLGIRLWARETGDAIREWIIDFTNTILGGVNYIREKLGKEPIEVFSNESSNIQKRRIQELRDALVKAGVDSEEAAKKAAEAFQAISIGGTVGNIGDGVTSILNSLGLGALLGFDAQEPTGGMPEDTPAATTTDDVAADIETFWSDIRSAWANSTTVSFEEFSRQTADKLGVDLAQAVSRAEFDSLGDVFLSSLQSKLQERVADKLDDVFSAFFDTFFEKISSGLQGGGGGLGGLISAGLSLFGFEKGGIVPGPDSEAVPALLHGGEAVIPADEVRALREGSGNQSTVVNQTIQVTGDVTDATRKAVREMGNEISSTVQSNFQERGVLAS